MKKNYHCCATCIHFAADKTVDGMTYRCVRLGYETKPTYTFNCWEPKPAVQRLMEKEKKEK
ncbi:hypothetical protein [Salsuginibacillus kocurii]|uniref:hypothetical protein n=1 Tax=Salsuginibacillus kocurii TaxID=427078 RepID=UPI00036769A8|nr:hypothetical protein [Salsuginibacillus kocurii]